MYTTLNLELTPEEYKIIQSMIQDTHPFTLDIGKIVVKGEFRVEETFAEYDNSIISSRHTAKICLISTSTTKKTDSEENKKIQSVVDDYLNIAGRYSNIRKELVEQMNDATVNFNKTKKSIDNQRSEAITNMENANEHIKNCIASYLDIDKDNILIDDAYLTEILIQLPLDDDQIDRKKLDVITDNYEIERIGNYVEVRLYLE